MKQPYFNTYMQRDEEWDPEAGGTYFATFREGDDGTLADGSMISGLEMSTQRNELKALLDVAPLVAKFPELKSRVVIVHAPCIYSRRDSWIEVATALELDEDILTDAARAYTGHDREAYKRRHNLGTSYF